MLKPKEMRMKKRDSVRYSSAFDLDAFSTLLMWLDYESPPAEALVLAHV